MATTGRKREGRNFLRTRSEEQEAEGVSFETFFEGEGKEGRTRWHLKGDVGDEENHGGCVILGVVVGRQGGRHQ
jgi:hypothetical protein